MNALACYADTILWLFLVTTYERRGSVFAHKVRIILSQDYSCRCAVCHPERA